MYEGLLIGSAVIAFALGFMLYIIFWSRKAIDYIHKNDLKSAREINKSLHERR